MCCHWSLTRLLIVIALVLPLKHWSLTRLLLVIALITLLAIGVVHECAFRAEPISRHH